MYEDKQALQRCVAVLRLPLLLPVSMHLFAVYCSACARASRYCAASGANPSPPHIPHTHTHATAVLETSLEEKQAALTSHCRQRVALLAAVGSTVSLPVAVLELAPGDSDSADVEAVGEAVAAFAAALRSEVQGLQQKVAVLESAASGPASGSGSRSVAHDAAAGAAADEEETSAQANAQAKKSTTTELQLQSKLRQAMTVIKTLQAAAAEAQAAHKQAIQVHAQTHQTHEQKAAALEMTLVHLTTTCDGLKVELRKLDAEQQGIPELLEKLEHTQDQLAAQHKKGEEQQLTVTSAKSGLAHSTGRVCELEVELGATRAELKEAGKARASSTSLPPVSSVIPPYWLRCRLF